MNQLRPTAECEQMNVVYAALREASVNQLREMFDASRAMADRAIAMRYSSAERDAELFAYQIRHEVRRRLELKSDD